MKSFFTILLFFTCTLTSIGQENSEYIDEFANAYFDKKSKNPIIIYDTIDGVPIDTLYNSNEKQCWYQIIINDGQEGWLRIESIRKIPGCIPNEKEEEKLGTYVGHWVKSENFIVDIQGYHEVSLYKHSDIKSKIVFRTAEYTQCHVLDVNSNWIKVWFEVDGKKIIGWLKPEDYCAWPWTACP